MCLKNEEIVASSLAELEEQNASVRSLKWPTFGDSVHPNLRSDPCELSTPVMSFNSSGAMFSNPHRLRAE